MILVVDLLIDFDPNDVLVEERTAGANLLDVAHHGVERGVLYADPVHNILRDRIPSRLGNNIALEGIANDGSIRKCAGRRGVIDLAKDDGSPKSVCSDLGSRLRVAGVTRIKQL